MDMKGCKRLYNNTENLNVWIKHFPEGQKNKD